MKQLVEFIVGQCKIGLFTLLKKMFEKCSLLPSGGRGVAFGLDLSVDPGNHLPNATPLQGAVDTFQTSSKNQSRSK
jgi:hypothetical protein